jgi:hypothetical protein
VKETSTFPECPADRELRARIEDFAHRLKKLFSSLGTEEKLFQLLLHPEGHGNIPRKEESRRACANAGEQEDAGEWGDELDDIYCMPNELK